MPPRRYPLNTSASKNSQAALTQRSLIDPHLEPQEGNQSQTHISSKYSKTLQSRTHAKKSLQQASSARPRGAGEAVGHDKCFGDEDSDSLDGIGEESGTDAEEQELNGIESDDLESADDAESQRPHKALKANHRLSVFPQIRTTAEVINNNGRHSPRDGRRPGDRLNRPVTVVRRNGVQCPSNPTAERASNASQQTSQETHSTGSRGISRGNSSSASAVPIHDSTNTPLQNMEQTSSREIGQPSQITRDSVTDRSRFSPWPTTHICKDLPESPIDTNIEEIYSILKAKQEYKSPFKTVLDRCCRLVARYYSIHTSSYTGGILCSLRYKHYLNSSILEMEEGEISPDIWFTNTTGDDILEKYAQFLDIEPAMLMMYYNDALSLAAQVLAPLRALPRLCWLIMSLLMKSKAFYLPLLGTKLMITLSMAPWLAISTTMPLTPSICIYRTYGRASHRSSHQPTYMMKKMWFFDSTIIAMTRKRMVASKLRSPLA
ncbi:hypothetical protein CNBD5420 [Cryptococcus deneoformans B-3501A]|uniref:Uncharacterized protein n=1 Tax=Cryptococcus deneoformans (strain JEC21 / ATCC MYA-565) TaxID=214684 RepID=Q5KJ28_CRYD1|nr:hypothetical protein CND00870 [Cryptococcus neoformans var. neoformans JEC21]XP_775813.1 hypothetical protein CNBD5420 [Cryptococcus neoformans var. neoformans B-3501A]AAW43021.1 hypothetical protein CND00870 [Cryptococcus neoformans var. neoformans JEC21]EAL21166.1 hypothetical protein CNBD5420 [Cryptococcus neoformans var. neoformans B-3501A]